MQRLILQRLILAGVVVAVIVLIISSINTNTTISEKISSVVVDPSKCALTHSWHLENITFPKDLTNSKVKLVAFLAASCGFCIQQSTRYSISLYFSNFNISILNF